MKRLIAVLLALVFCAMTLPSPANALGHDPSKTKIWQVNTANPSGDDGGWADVDQGGRPGQVIVFEFLGKFRVFVSHSFKIYIAPVNAEHNTISERHGITDRTGTDGNQRSNSE